MEEYANAKYNPYAQMSKVQITLAQAMAIEGINRYVVDGLPLKTSTPLKSQTGMQH
ncbi:MAG: hypothetical protein QM757_45965 [Paludibaculum sp.]